jgi:hypothetical protein
METWRKVWREGVAPLVSTSGLEALESALKKDDDRLLQGVTTAPPPLHSVRDWAVEGACVIGYCGWQGDGLQTVAEVEAFFAEVCFQVDRDLGEPAACRGFLNWFDDSPRHEVRELLLGEVRRTLKNRRAPALRAALAKGA